MERGVGVKLVWGRVLLEVAGRVFMVEAVRRHLCVGVDVVMLGVEVVDVSSFLEEG